MTLDQLRLYDSQNVQYAEFMVSSSCPNDRDRFVKAVSEAADDAAKLAALEASGLADCVAARRNDLTAAMGKIRTALACDGRNAQPGCGVTFRYIVQINRHNAPDDVFDQTAITAALLRAEPCMSRSILSGPKTVWWRAATAPATCRSSAFSPRTCRSRCTRANCGSALFRRPILRFTSGKPSRSPARAVSDMASRWPSNVTWRASSPRCARGQWSSRSTSPAMT